MTLSKILMFSIFTACLAAAAFPAHAGEPRLIKKFSDWDTYKFTEGDDLVCYMATKAKIAGQKEPDPKQQSHLGKLDNKRTAYAIITNRPGDGTRNVFSYLAGYSYKPGSEVTVDIDGQKFMLYTSEDSAWTADADTDNKITKAIKSGKTMTVKGTPAKGKPSTDTISLKGSTDAHEAISRECY
jgi:hypothetical protein